MKIFRWNSFDFYCFTIATLRGFYFKQLLGFAMNLSNFEVKIWFILYTITRKCPKPLWACCFRENFMHPFMVTLFVADMDVKIQEHKILFNIVLITILSTSVIV